MATFTNIWLYPDQTQGWKIVSIAKLSSWYLLMMLSFVLVTLINDINLHTVSDKLNHEKSKIDEGVRQDIP
ncbi:MAG: DUF817 domain-containing protein, partial [Gammaproteobacteria bacterium]|nr:DUF817 domain-containing protein [Gammaproteobacteria bacterium]